MKQYSTNLLKIPKMVNDELKLSVVPPENRTRDNEEKVELIAQNFKNIMEVLGLDLSNDSLCGTPQRVAKMYVHELCNSLNPAVQPEITIFKNDFHYHSPLVELNIPFASICEHHFLPFLGKVNIAYFPKENIIGLSKLHRVVTYFSQQPQVQERLTQQIMESLKMHLRIEDIGVAIKASHNCIACRGVQDLGSATVTSVFSGKVLEDENLIVILRKFK